MSRQLTLAFLLVIFIQAEAAAGIGGGGIGGVGVWQTPENEPGAQTRREAAQTRVAPGRMRHHHHRHHTM